VDGFDLPTKSAGNTALIVFPICVMLVFLILSAQYESWALPLAVILIVPMCLLSAMSGVWLKGSDNNVLTQIGFIVLVGAGLQERDLDRGVQPRERVESGRPPAGSCGRSLSPAAAAHPHDIVRIHHGRRTAGHRDRGGKTKCVWPSGIAVFSGMLGVTFIRVVPDAGFLHDHRRPAGAAPNDASTCRSPAAADAYGRHG